MRDQHHQHVPDDVFAKQGRPKMLEPIDANAMTPSTKRPSEEKPTTDAKRANDGATVRRLPASWGQRPASASAAAAASQNGSSSRNMNPTLRYCGRVVYCTSCEQIETACSWISNAEEHAVMQHAGFDAEWAVRFIKGSENLGKVALIQMCVRANHQALGKLDGPNSFYIGTDGCPSQSDPTGAAEDGTACVVFLLHISLCGGASLPQGLAALLRNGGLKKYGVNINCDAIKIRKDWNVQLEGHVDLCSLVPQHPRYGVRFGAVKQFSLADLAQLFLGTGASKEPTVRLSDWERELSFTQKLYAATDAWLGLRIYEMRNTP